MSDFDPATVAQYELETWSRCADVYLDSFADLTRRALPFLVEAAAIEPGDRVLEIGSGPAMSPTP